MSEGLARAAGLALDEGPVERTAIDTLCALATSAANGPRLAAPAAMAPLVYVVWQRFLRFDPDDPGWPNRDRFVLCADDGASLLHALLHLAGVKSSGAHHERELAVTLGDLERLRECPTKDARLRADEVLPGEYLLHGDAAFRLGTSAGLALAARERALRFNRPGFVLFDYDVYALCEDGCLGEAAASDAARLAAERQLSNLCWIYDATRPVRQADRKETGSEDLAERMRACGWSVLHVDDATDTGMLSCALAAFRTERERPTLIVVGGEAAAPPAAEPRLRVPAGVREHFRDGSGRRGRALRSAWFVRLEAYREGHPELAQEIERMQQLEPEKNP